MKHILESDHHVGDWSRSIVLSYRRKQIQRWLFQGRAEGFDDMSDLPKASRDQVSENFQIWTTKVVEHQVG